MEHEPIRIIAGLGNPGPRHALDRHNVGFWFVDALAQRLGARFRDERKFHGELCRVEIDGRDLRLVKPATYMNRSGQSLQSVCAYLQVPASAVLVAHDDLDLPPGVVRLKRGGGHGGHNGLRDVIAHLGPDFFRLRIGVGHPGNRNEVIDYVLSRAPRDEEDAVLEALGDALDVMPVLLGQGDQKAMHHLHSRGVTPRPYRKPADDAGDGGGEAGGAD